MTNDNPQLAMANEFLEYTDINIFLTGRAGTGKTTFLHTLRKRSPKRMVVVAPTGVAAINAGGVTINSFFQIAPGVHIPGQKIVQQGPKRFDQKMSRAKLDIIRSMELLVIDEISMVRADMLDAVDSVLRQHRDRSKPFGGVQLLMIGDLQQLAPVVKDQEWELLRSHYSTPFFFSSQALSKSRYVSIELRQIYRQSDSQFIDMLEAVRTNRIDHRILEALNARHRPDFDPDTSEGYITLTSHNHASKRINDKKLKQLKSDRFEYSATITGDFSETNYPIDELLVLKEGAQVMFTKNDTSAEKLFVNGTIGTVTHLDNERIEVTVQEKGSLPIVVEKAVWESVKYTISDNSKEITQSIVGTFTHYPLKTAWAITIHKSQGLTFERAIIDAGDSFSHGQVYVALSRCKSLEGLVLSTPLSSSSIINDQTVTHFNADISANQPSEIQLECFKREYYEKLLLEQFDFERLYLHLTFLRNYQTEHLLTTYPKLIALWDSSWNAIGGNITAIGTKFRNQLRALYHQNDPLLGERIAKAATYFIEQLEGTVTPIITASDVEIDNKSTRKVAKEALERATEELRVKLATLRYTLDEGFSVNGYLNAKGRAAIASPPEQLLTKPTKKAVTTIDTAEQSDILNPELFNILRAWRSEQAKELGVPSFMIFTQKVLVGLSNTLPQTAKEMLAIKGVGAKFVDKYGTAIAAIIDDYIAGREGAYHDDESDDESDD